MHLNLSSIFRRLLVSSAAILLVACAEAPVDTSAQPAQVAATAAPTKTCQTDYTTGSHYTHSTVCQSDDEESDSQQQASDAMRSMSLQTRPPSGK